MKKYYFVSVGKVDKIAHIEISAGVVEFVLESGETILLSFSAYKSLNGVKVGDEVSYQQTLSIHKCNSKDQAVNVLGSREDLELLKATMAKGEFI